MNLLYPEVANVELETMAIHDHSEEEIRRENDELRQFSPQARKRWEKVPDWAKEEILKEPIPKTPGTGSFCGVFGAKCACPPLRSRFWDRLKAVWCGNCLKGTPVQLHAGRMEDQCLILEGTCKICGHDVARVIEPEE